MWNNWAWAFEREGRVNGKRKYPEAKRLRKPESKNGWYATPLTFGIRRGGQGLGTIQSKVGYSKEIQVL